MFEKMKKYAVSAENASDFCNRYFKQDRLNRCKNEIIQSKIEELKKYGYSTISRHDSITGDIVTFYGEQEENT